MDRAAVGRALLLLGLLAVLRTGCFSSRPASWAVVGEPVALRLEALAGEEFRLLPGVGPVLAERLELARQAAGGHLDLKAAGRVHGVGPVLLARWQALRGEELSRR